MHITDIHRKPLTDLLKEAIEKATNRRDAAQKSECFNEATDQDMLRQTYEEILREITEQPSASD